MDSRPHADVPGSARLLMPTMSSESVAAIVGGRRFPEWAPDYPDDGDREIAGLLFRQAPEVAAARVEPWTIRQVVERDAGLVVGGIGIFAPPDASGQIEIGYGIVPSRQRRGYATEALRALLAMAWSHSVVMSVVAGVDRHNVASRRVLEKAGLRREPSVAHAGLRYRIDRAEGATTPTTAPP